MDRPANAHLPHSIDAERSVVGGILLHPRAFLDVASVLAADDFYHPAHATIFGAMCDLAALSKPVDEVTIAAHLLASDRVEKLRGVGGLAYFAELTAAVVTVENIAFHARMIAGKARVRRLIETAHEIAARGYGAYGDLDEYMAESQAAIIAATAPTRASNAVPWNDVLHAAIKETERLYQTRGQLTGYPSGLADLDEMTAGFQAAELVILAARPSMGKSALIMEIVINAARQYAAPALVFSLEMGRRSLGQRALSGAASVEMNAIRRGNLKPVDWVRMTNGAARISNLPITVDDSSAVSLAYVRSRAMQWRAQTAPRDKHPHAAIVIDYLQIMAPEKKRGKEQNRERDVADLTAGLKALAKDLDCPVIALSQLSRALESRPDKRPRLSDLRDSGAIEQDGDLILFLYRDEVYDAGTKFPGVAEILIGKQRNGATGTISVRFEDQFTRFTTLNRPHGG